MSSSALLTLLLAFFSAAQTFAQPIKVGTCETSDGQPVIILKQWHYAPGTNTHPTHGPLPQDKNQIEIFDFLKDQIEHGKIKTVIAEGCSGEINEKFSPAFNGWSYSDLDEARKAGTLAHAQTMAPLKIEVLLKDRINTVCGDDLDLLKKQLLKLSDVRGALGFLSRIEQLKDKPEQRSSYIKSAKEVFKLDPKMKDDTVIQHLHDSMKESLRESISFISQRNAHFVETVKANLKSGPIAVVIGGIHAPDLTARLSKEKIPCTLMQPSAYVADEEELMKQLENFK